MIHFQQHFDVGFGQRVDVLSNSTMAALIQSNAALRHAICALTILNFPSRAPSLATELVSHLKLSTACIQKSLDNGIVEQGTLLAILVLLQFEVY